MDYRNAKMQSQTEYTSTLHFKWGRIHALDEEKVKPKTTINWPLPQPLSNWGFEHNRHNKGNLYMQYITDHTSTLT